MANSLTALLNSSNLDTNNGRYVHNIINGCRQGKLKHNSGTVKEKKNGKIDLAISKLVLGDRKNGNHKCAFKINSGTIKDK